MFSVWGGRPWSELEKGSSAKRMVGWEEEESDVVEMVVFRCWILRGVLAMVMVKPVLCWIWLARARKGMI